VGQENDFYAGYEGEPEYIFRIERQPTSFLRIWGGYIDAIMNAVTPGPSGWHSLAKFYHLDEGWFEESPWRIPELPAALDQLHAVDSSELDEQPKRVLTALCELFQIALSEGLDVVIVYD
jgi:hypothetical protein